MTVVVVLVAIGFVAWRYRRFFGFEPADRGRPERLPERADGAQATRPWWLPTIDSKHLPAALLAGGCVAAAGITLDLLTHPILAQAAVLVVGPITGGMVVRSRWWPIVAAAVATVAGGGGRLGPLVVALPVAVIAYGSVRFDWRGLFERWTAET